MIFRDWEPLYLEILDYFSFSREADEEAARLLGSLVTADALPLLEDLIRGRPVTVCGNAPCLSNQLDQVEGTVIAADAAAEVLYTRGIRPDAVFTDLDGATDCFLQMNAEGTVMVVHAHGDNIPLVSSWFPRFTGPVVAPTQGTPLSRVHNFGGFSDGDRAVFAADALGATGIRILGFDLDDQSVDPVKRGKLFWARRLLAILGYDL
jgi:2-amino-4-hydroxy-6-hydroxymethyldihydropteridine diphosphokinase